MTRTFITFVIMVLMLASCEQEPTLQKYYVEKSDSKNFVTLDIAPNFIKTDGIKLTAEEKEALNSLDKFNVLIYKKDSLDTGNYKKEAEDVKKLLKSDSYDELMKINYSGMGASISTKGEGENIDEFVVFVKNDETGFGVVRALGDDITPNKVLTLASLLQKGSLDNEQLKPLKMLMGNQQQTAKADKKVEVKKEIKE